jgi:hypothetical protein
MLPDGLYSTTAISAYFRYLCSHQSAPVCLLSPSSSLVWTERASSSLWSRLVASMRHMGSSAGRVLSKTNSHGLSVNLFAQGIEQVAREQTLDILEQLVFLTADMCSKQGGEFEQQRR